MAAYSAAAFIDSGGWPGVFARLFAREDLSRAEAAQAFAEILGGRAEPSQIAAFVAALRTKGETVEEIAGCIEAMRDHGESVAVAPGAIDTCGTGGDRAGTINVSTLAALVAAACGVRVVKHGNRAASSLAGSADVLEALGVAIDLGPAGVQACVEEAGIGFCFAPRFHPAMRHAGPVRRELGVATLFNLLGPIANPARVRRQAVGIGDPRVAEKMLGALEAGGAEHALVFYGDDGLDELTTTTTSTMFSSRRGPDGTFERARTTVDPGELGIARAAPESLRGGSPADNARRAVAILSGETGPQRDLVVLNAAAALLVADRVGELSEGIVLAAAALDSGAAHRVLERLRESSNAQAASA